MQRDATIFFSYRGRVVAQLTSGFFSVAVFYYVSRLVSSNAFHSSDDYFAFVVVGLATFGILATTVATLPTDIRQELMAGTFERIFLSPFGPIAAIVSMSIFPFVMGLLAGVVTVTLARLAFGMPVAWSTAPLTIPVLLLGALTFLPFGLLAAAGAIALKQAAIGVGLVTTLISLVGGVFFPVSMLPDWIQWTSGVQPFTPTLDLLRHWLAGAPMKGSESAALLKMVLFATVLLPPTLWALYASIRLAQRRGTITEY
jgi:ABC-2 type transport system permease protein